MRVLAGAQCRAMGVAVKSQSNTMRSVPCLSVAVASVATMRPRTSLVQPCDALQRVTRRRRAPVRASVALSRARHHGLAIDPKPWNLDERDLLICAGGHERQTLPVQTLVQSRSSPRGHLNLTGDDRTYRCRAMQQPLRRCHNHARRSPIMFQFLHRISNRRILSTILGVGAAWST